MSSDGQDFGGVICSSGMVGQLTTEPAPSPRHLLELLQQVPGPQLDLDLLSGGGRFGPAHRRQKSATPAHPPAAAAAASGPLQGYGRGYKIPLYCERGYNLRAGCYCARG